MKFIFTILILIPVVYFGSALVDYAIAKSELVECLKLQTQAETMNGFYLTEWQAQMCNRYSIKINAPIIATK